MEIICKCGHSIEEHDDDGCSIMHAKVKSGDFARAISCECSLSPEKILRTKLMIAIVALEQIKRAKGGVIAVDSLGHIRDMPDYEGNIATHALEEIYEIK
jgi:hypothetical protein